MRLTLAVILIVAACGRTTEHAGITGASVQAVAGDTVALRIGDTAVLGDAARITFSAVEADSRCPINVDCVWEGDAQIRLAAEQTPGGSTTIELHTTLQPRTAAFAGFRIEMVELAPQPQEPGPIQPQHYSVRLAISRG